MDEIANLYLLSIQIGISNLKPKFDWTSYDHKTVFTIGNVTQGGSHEKVIAVIASHFDSWSL